MNKKNEKDLLKESLENNDDNAFDPNYQWLTPSEKERKKSIFNEKIRIDKERVKNEQEQISDNQMKRESITKESIDKRRINNKRIINKRINIERTEKKHINIFINNHQTKIEKSNFCELNFEIINQLKDFNVFLEPNNFKNILLSESKEKNIDLINNIIREKLDLNNKKYLDLIIILNRMFENYIEKELKLKGNQLKLLRAIYYNLPESDLMGRKLLSDLTCLGESTISRNREELRKANILYSSNNTNKREYKRSNYYLKYIFEEIETRLIKQSKELEKYPGIIKNVMTFSSKEILAPDIDNILK